MGCSGHGTFPGAWKGAHPLPLRISALVRRLGLAVEGQTMPTLTRLPPAWQSPLR